MDDKGSVIVEMCLVMPILIGVVFVVINLFVAVMNYSIATGEAYTVLYNREEYILLGDSDYSDTAEKVMEENVRDNTVFTEDVEAATLMVDEGLVEHGAAADPVLGICENRISYTEKYPGIDILINESSRKKDVAAKREIRNTSNNLRRWQMYGEVLSE